MTQIYHSRIILISAIISSIISLVYYVIKTVDINFNINVYFNSNNSSSIFLLLLIVFITTVLSMYLFVFISNKHRNKMILKAKKEFDEFYK